MMDVYFEKELNRREKVKWLSVLNTLPYFVMIYDRVTDSIKYLNNHLKRTLIPDKFDEK
jgi:hypothetical protein